MAGPSELFLRSPALKVYEEGIDVIVGEVKPGGARLTPVPAGKDAGFRHGAHWMLPAAQDPGGGAHEDIDDGPGTARGHN